MSQSITVSKNGQRLRVMNEIVTIKLTGEQTDNRYAIVESITQPNDGVPLLHTHPHQETFQVLEGQYVIFGRDEAGNKVATPAPTGSVIHIPGGAPHGFLNVGDTEGKLIMTMEPAGMENFFYDIGFPLEGDNLESAAAGPPDMDALMAICAKHNIEFLEAPPA